MRKRFGHAGELGDGLEQGSVVAIEVADEAVGEVMPQIGVLFDQIGEAE